MRMMSGIHLILIPAGFLIIDDIHIPADLPHVHGNAQACGKAGFHAAEAAVAWTYG